MGFQEDVESLSNKPGGQRFAHGRIHRKRLGRSYTSLIFPIVVNIIN